MEDEQTTMWNEHGRAAQLPQYDDITLRNMEVINVESAMRSAMLFGADNITLFNNLKLFHMHFSGLHAATYLEVELKKEDGEEVVKFIDYPIKFVGKFNSPENRQNICDSIYFALKINGIYQKALKDAGFRKVTYFTVRPEYAHRRNF